MNAFTETKLNKIAHNYNENWCYCDYSEWGVGVGDDGTSTIPEVEGSVFIPDGPAAKAAMGGASGMEVAACQNSKSFI